MPTKKSAPPFSIAEALIGAFATNNRIDVYLIQNLPDEAWNAPPLGGKGRSIPAIAAHIHNVRLMWLKAAAKGSRIPPQLDRLKVTVDQARKGLAASHAAVAKLVEASLDSGGKVKNFPPDVAAFVAYLVSHDAHHRGQICMLSRQLGHRLPNAVMFGMWEWNKRRQEAGL